jgi:hypothetical protein
MSLSFDYLFTLVWLLWLAYWGNQRHWREAGRTSGVECIPLW